MSDQELTVAAPTTVPVEYVPAQPGQLISAILELARDPNFDATKLDQLYPNHGPYVSQFTQAANEAVSQGFLLKPDAQTLLDEATHSGIGK